MSYNNLIFLCSAAVVIFGVVKTDFCKNTILKFLSIFSVKILLYSKLVMNVEIMRYGSNVNVSAMRRTVVMTIQSFEIVHQIVVEEVVIVKKTLKEIVKENV